MIFLAIFHPVPLPSDLAWHTKLPEHRAEVIWETLCDIQGCPVERDVTAWLLWREGSTLQHADQILMARGIRYRFDRFGFENQLSGFTSFYNPKWDRVLDWRDWQLLLTHAPQEYYDIVDGLEEIRHADAKYLYWWCESEVVGEFWKMEYTSTTTVEGRKFYFSGIPNVRNCALRGLCP